MESNNNNNNNSNTWKEKQIVKYDKHDRTYVQISEGFYCGLEYDELGEEDKQKAIRELRETPEIVQESLEKFRELLKADDHLFVPYEHDEYLIKFLRPRKYYADSAYKLIRSYYKCKKKYPKYCENLLPHTGIQGFRYGIVQSQPRRTQDGARILVVNVGGKWDPSQVSLEEVFRSVQLCLEAAILEQSTQVNGCVTIFDVEGLSFKQIWQFTPNFAFMLLEWIQVRMLSLAKNKYVSNFLSYYFRNVSH